MRTLLLVLLALALAGCSDDTPAFDAGLRDAGRPEAGLPPFDAGPDAGAADAAAPDATPDDVGTVDAGLMPGQVWVEVRLDGVPVEGAVVVQGGGTHRWQTGPDGRVVVEVDASILGDQVILASHPDARIVGESVPAQPGLLVIELFAFDRSDNPDYAFQDPGEPGRRPDTTQCGHCHQTFDDEWFASPHRTSAKNPTVQDLYAGAASGFTDEASCLAAGGRWATGRLPGGGAGARCYVGQGVLSALDPACEQAPCAGPPANVGDCADCHAPGMNGVIGGRDLLEADGFAYEYGVHCDVCHRVEAVDEASLEPGVAGRLSLLRPSEPGSPALGAGGRRPLTFGPSHDSPNPRMGGVQRDHFREARFCAGCHQLDSPVLLPGASLDPNRWPSGRLPVQSTYAEWLAGPLSPAAPCQSCHMPPAPERINGGDLQRFPDAEVGFQGGWYRAPGAVRRHVWYGPRQPEGKMLEMAAKVFLRKTVVQDRLVAEVTVKNVGAGHAIPTGEPMRHLVLRVDAFCGTSTQAAVGGDVVPDFGGAREVRARSEDRIRWPGAVAGDRLRVVERLRGFYEYPGVGPFGDGTFTASEKGMPLEAFVGEVQVLSVAPDGAVTLDGPLPDGAFTYLVRGAEDHAGAPGFGFARVLSAPDGTRMVPHFLADDVVSDNRLMPQVGFTSTHEFRVSCAEPVVQARLLYRPYTVRIAEARGWSNPSQLMDEVRR